MNLVLTSALTCVLSPRRGFHLSSFQVIRMTVRPIQSLVFPKTRGTFLPLLGGEGQGEDGRETNYFVVAPEDGRASELFPACKIVTDDGHFNWYRRNREEKQPVLWIPE